MALRDNEINIPELLWEWAGGGNETKWNQIVDWINSGGFATDNNRDGRSYPAGSMATTAALNTGSGFPRWTLPDAASTSVFINFGVPSWWTNLRIGFDLVNDAAGTGNVTFQYILKGCPAGTAVASATTFYNQTVTTPAPLAGVHSTLLVAEDIPVTHGPFGTLFSFQLTRLGSDGGDTLAGAIGLEEIVVARTTAV